MSKNRIVSIDNLRAFSLLGVVIIHILSFHLTNTLSTFMWNFLEFVVVAFVFCSGFVSNHYKDQLDNKAQIKKWYFKRFERLYLPFFIYFLIHFSLFVFFPQIFSHFGFQKNLSFFLSSLFLFGGANTNWLPLVFVEMAILTPLLFLLSKKKNLWIYMVLMIFTTGFFTFFTFPYNLYREVMWMPWSLVLLLGIYYVKFSKKEKYLVFLINIFVFIIAALLLMHFHRSISFYDNKYPPTLYYLSFGILCTQLSIAILSTIQFPKRVQEAINFISINSYTLFFIHYIVLDFIESTRLSGDIFLEIILVYLLTGGVFFTIQYTWKLFSKISYSLSAKTTVRSE